MPAGDYATRPIAQGGVFQPRTAIEYGEAQVLPQTPIPDFAKYAEIELKKQLLKQEEDEKARKEAEIPTADVHHAARRMYNNLVGQYRNWYYEQSKTRSNDPTFDNEVTEKRAMLIGLGQDLHNMQAVVAQKDAIRALGKDTYEGEQDFQDINSEEYFNKYTDLDTATKGVSDAYDKLGRVREIEKPVSPAKIAQEVARGVHREPTGTIQTTTKLGQIETSYTYDEEKYQRQFLSAQSGEWQNNPKLQKLYPQQEDYLDYSLNFSEKKALPKTTQQKEGITEMPGGFKTPKFTFTLGESGSLGEAMFTFLSLAGFPVTKDMKITKVDLTKIVGVDITDIEMPSYEDPDKTLETKLMDFYKTPLGIYAHGKTKDMVITRDNLSKIEGATTEDIGKVIRTTSYRDYYYPLDKIEQKVSDWTGAPDLIKRIENLAKKATKPTTKPTGTTTEKAAKAMGELFKTPQKPTKPTK